MFTLNLSITLAALMLAFIIHAIVTRKRRPATLYIVQGFIGAGKTTYSKQLAKETRALRLNADEYVAAHFSAEQQAADWEACFGKAVETLWRDAEEKLKAGKSVILDFGFWSRASRDHARDKARGLGVPCELIYLDTRDDVMRERIAQRSGPIAERNLRDFAETKKQFEPPLASENPLIVRR